MDRRQFLALTGTGISLVSGCAGLSDESPTPTGTPPNETPPPEHATATESQTQIQTETPASRTEVTESSGTYISAFYYPWYSPTRHWDTGYKLTPVLGEYSSREPAVIKQHVSWAANHGVNAFYLSWWGPNSWEDRTIRNHFIPHADFHSLDFAILYESTGRLNVQSGQIDLSKSRNRTRLRNDFHFLEDRFFDSPGYPTINGKYPVFLYLTRIFSGEIKAAIGGLRESTDHPLYLIGDQVYWQSPSDSQSQAVLDAMDAVTAYNMHTSVSGIDEGFIDKVADQYTKWRQAAEDHNTEFIPNVIPGFDDSAVRPNADHPVISRSPDRFNRFLETVRPMTTDIPMLSITSFNEWHENTQIEPAEQYDNGYLEALANVV